jgi:hypothetical protein
MTSRTTAQQLAADILMAVQGGPDPLGAVEKALPWLSWMGSSARSEATGEILLRARDAAADGNTDPLARAILVWHERLATGVETPWNDNPQDLVTPLDPISPPPPYDSRAARLERDNRPFSGLPPRDERRIGYLIYRISSEWRAVATDQTFLQFTTDLPRRLGMGGRDPSTIADAELTEALTQIQDKRERDRTAQRASSPNKVVVPEPFEPVPRAEETIRRLFLVARENGWSESDALMWLTSSSAAFPRPKDRGVYYLDNPEYIARQARDQFDAGW